MIKLTKLNDVLFVLNADLIETIEATPDTIITLLNGKKFVVKESIEEIVEKAITYQQRISRGITVLENIEVLENVETSENVEE
ncbi:MAG: flagellar FlbD family protein [Clostridia bacterium]|jgi:flagellar protein FlbD|nr:flagellar FlbD family protein [Clostridia bacterium]